MAPYTSIIQVSDALIQQDRCQSRPPSDSDGDHRGTLVSTNEHGCVSILYRFRSDRDALCGSIFRFYDLSLLPSNRQHYH